MAERSGESANDASDTKPSRTQHQQESSTKDGENEVAQGGSKTADKAHNAEAGDSGEECKAGAARESGSGSAGAGVVQAVQERVGGNRRTHSECARYALRMPVLPEVAPSTWSGAGI